MAMLILCRVGAQPPPGAEEGACLGECAPGVWCVGRLEVGWVLTGTVGMVFLCLSSVDLITSSPQGLRDLVAWVHGHATSCGALPNLQRTLSSEYCGVIQAVWGCDQGHDYTTDADSSCGALLLDSALAVKWTWDKEMAPWLTQHRGSNPTGAAPQSSQGKATTAPAETETLPSMDMAQPPADVNPVGPGLGPPPQPSFPSSGAPGRRLLWAVRPRFLVLSQAGPSAGSECLHHCGQWSWCCVQRFWEK